MEQALSCERRIETCDPALDDPRQIAEAVIELCRYWERSFRSVEMEGQLGAPDWMGYELRIWRLGESLRLFCKKRGWRGNGPILEAATSLIARPEYGKGRQSVALLVGEMGGVDYSAALGRAIDDPEICGHAIKALTKLRVAGFASQVAAVQAREAGWVRRAARKYLEVVGHSPSVAP